MNINPFKEGDECKMYNDFIPNEMLKQVLSDYEPAGPITLDVKKEKAS
jgi:hypothetical protein